MKLFTGMVSLFHVVKSQGKYVYIYVLFVASNTLASLSSPSTHAWMDT